jgi:hypothetical protein
MKIFATHYNTISSVNIVHSDKVLLLQKDYLLCSKKAKTLGLTHTKLSVLCSPGWQEILSCVRLFLRSTFCSVHIKWDFGKFEAGS